MIAELTAAIEQEADKYPEAQRLMTHPGGSGCTYRPGVRADHRGGEALQLWQTDRRLSRSGASRRIQWRTAAVGTHPVNKATRCCVSCWWKRAQATVRGDRRWRKQFFYLAKRRGRKIAKVAMARRLAVRLYWMWRRGWDYEQLQSFGPQAGQPGNLHGVR